MIKLKFEFTDDITLIKEVMTTQLVWDHIIDDYAGSPEDFIPIIAPAILYIKMTNLDTGVLYGVFILVKFSTILADLHSCILPNLGGYFSVALREVFKYVFQNTEYLRITTSVPVINRLGLKAALSSGLKEWGRNPKSFMRHNTLVDQVTLGINKDEVIK